MPPPSLEGENEDGSEQDRQVYWFGSRELMSLNQNTFIFPEKNQGSLLRGRILLRR